MAKKASKKKASRPAAKKSARPAAKKSAKKKKKSPTAGSEQALRELSMKLDKESAIRRGLPIWTVQLEQQKSVLLLIGKDKYFRFECFGHGAEYVYLQPCDKDGNLTNPPGTPLLKMESAKITAFQPTDNPSYPLSIPTSTSAPEEIAPDIRDPKCRECGCTQDDCSQCIEKTGKPCYWVENDLCSACAQPATPTSTEDAKSILLDLWTKANLDLQGLNMLIESKREEKSVDALTIPVAVKGMMELELPELEDTRAAQARYVEALNRAVMRCENGTYGICAITNNPIEPERLQEIPWATISKAAEDAGGVSTDDQLRPAVQSNRFFPKTDPAPTTATPMTDEESTGQFPAVLRKEEQMKKQYNKAFKHHYSSGELNMKGEELALATKERDEIIEEKKSVVKDYNDRIESTDTRIRALSNAIRQKFEMRNHDVVYLFLDYDNFQRVWYAADKVTELGREPFKPEDHQTTIPLMEEDAGGPEEAF